MNPSKITTTVGLNIGKIDIAGVRFNFWDLGGQEELQSLWDKVISTLIHQPFVDVKQKISNVKKKKKCFSITQNRTLSST